MLAPATYTVTGAFAFSGIDMARHSRTLLSHDAVHVRGMCERQYKISPGGPNESRDSRGSKAVACRSQSILATPCQPVPGRISAVPQAGWRKNHQCVTRSQVVQHLDSDAKSRSGRMHLPVEQLPAVDTCASRPSPQPSPQLLLSTNRQCAHGQERMGSGTGLVFGHTSRRSIPPSESRGCLGIDPHNDTTAALRLPTATAKYSRLRACF